VLGTGFALEVAWAVAVVLVLVVLAAGGLAARRILLGRGGGTIECGLRRSGGGWRLGMAAYRASELRWYRAFGCRLAPSEVLDRRELTVVGRRRPTTAEASRLGPGKVVVSCRIWKTSGTAAGSSEPAVPHAFEELAGPGAGAREPADPVAQERLTEPGGSASARGTVELALDEAALTGFLAWLESVPPGSYRLGW
jgi:hypothetical protein